MTNNSVWSSYFQLRQNLIFRRSIGYLYRENKDVVGWISKTLNMLWKCEISGFIQSPWELRLTIHWLSSGGRPSTEHQNYSPEDVSEAPESFQKAGLDPASAAARSQSSQRRHHYHRPSWSWTLSLWRQKTMVPQRLLWKSEAFLRYHVYLGLVASMLRWSFSQRGGEGGVSLNSGSV